ncbi:MAG TPA: hypothetical protein VNP04_02080, partial [Alphaproteobacteria bacterium]|nr:hypothetical protein [Alphaproteobacteria bacterium]
GIPIVQVGFQDEPVGPLLGRGDAVHQLIRARTPPASPFDDSPTLLPPTEIAVELPVGHMQEAELGQGAAVWLRKDEADGIRIDDLQTRPRLEVQMRASRGRLL